MREKSQVLSSQCLTWVLSGQLHLLADLSDGNCAVATDYLLHQIDDGLLRHLITHNKNVRHDN